MLAKKLIKIPIWIKNSICGTYVSTRPKLVSLA
jgi:hypothetical protein